jgi:hypothetical protein
MGGDPVLGYDATGNNLNQLYSFVDLMANWTSILVFLCVLFPMAGCLMNRKTKKIDVKPVKGFVPTTWISLIIIGLGMAFVIISSFANVILVAGWAKDIGHNIIDPSGASVVYEQATWNIEMLGAIMTLVVLAIFLCICTIPSIFEVRREKAVARGEKRISRKAN